MVVAVAAPVARQRLKGVVDVGRVVDAGRHLGGLEGQQVLVALAEGHLAGEGRLQRDVLDLVDAQERGLAVAARRRKGMARRRRQQSGAEEAVVAVGAGRGAGRRGRRGRVGHDGRRLRGGRGPARRIVVVVVVEVGEVGGLWDMGRLRVCCCWRWRYWACWYCCVYWPVSGM